MTPSTDLRTRVPETTVEQLLAAGDAVVIDLRSPGEHAEDAVPGSVNVPLLDDAQRAVVGTLYARRGPDAAFDEARERVVERVQDLVGAIAEAAGWDPPGEDPRAIVARRTEAGIAALESDLEGAPLDALPARPVVLHCWRGGLRSRSVVALVRELGLTRAVGLAGGYKAWRGAVTDGLAAWEVPPAFVLRGLTGVGKTLVLRALERARPGWTLDLEGLAGHRSSILGMVGLAPVSQRRFETGLFTRMRAGFPGPVVFEGESRKVGDAVVPPRVWEALDGGTNLLLTAPLARRVEVLAEDYLATPESRAQLRGQLPWLEERIAPQQLRGELVRMLDEDRIAELVELLLERWYDPRYRRSEEGRTYDATIDASDPDAAAERVAVWIEDRGAR